MMTETKTEIMLTMLLQDQDLMVLSFIQPLLLGNGEEYRDTTVKALWP